MDLNRTMDILSFFDRIDPSRSDSQVKCFNSQVHLSVMFCIGFSVYILSTIGRLILILFELHLIQPIGGSVYFRLFVNTMSYM